MLQGDEKQGNASYGFECFLIFPEPWQVKRRQHQNDIQNYAIMKTKYFLISIFLSFTFFTACQQEELGEISQDVKQNSIEVDQLKESPSNPNNNPCDVDELNLRILFIGNSFTANFTTDIPIMFEELAIENGQSISTIAKSAQLGLTLANHLSNSTTLNLVNQGNWDYVILQENSGYLANGNTTGFTNSVNSFVNLIDNNSPEARILLFQVVPPVGHTSIQYTILHNQWNTLFDNVANSHSNVYVANIGQVFTNAYTGSFAFGYSVTSPDELRFPQSGGYHFFNSGGFLAAVTFYSVIFANKPCLPDNMTFFLPPGQLGIAQVSVAVPQFDAVAQIGYQVGRYAVHMANKRCRFSYGKGDYPCDE